MAGKKQKKLEGEFKINDCSSAGAESDTKRRRRVDPRLEQANRKVISMAKRFAEANLDMDRPVSRVFKAVDGKCILLGLTCDCGKPCLECQVGHHATLEIKFLIDAYLGSKV